MKYVVFLIDGMADFPIESLKDRTPLQVAKTPNLDKLAQSATYGTFLTLPADYPTSSDVANMSVMGWDLSRSYTGRGAVECYGAGYELAEDEIAFRMNLITVKNGVIEDYSAGHLEEEIGSKLIEDLNATFGTDELQIKKGMSYRNLLFLKGKQFSVEVDYAKPDSSHGEKWEDILPTAKIEAAEHTAYTLRDLVYLSEDFLSQHSLNIERVKQGKNPANLVWPWSGGAKPQMPSFYELYGKKGAVVSAVDVILGLGRLGGMEVVKPEGATGFVDTNYENKAQAGIDLLKDHDFVYVHVEAVDECGHLGDLDLKIKTIEAVDKRLIGTFFDKYNKEFDEPLRILVLPDHPVPVSLRKHTRDEVPFMLYGQGIVPDENIKTYNEKSVLGGSHVHLKGRELMDLLFSNAARNLV